jgi:outer membrane biosynthesis protein TonB
MLGKLLGRKTSDIRYFTGKREYTPRSESSYFNNYTPSSMSTGGSRKATRVLEKMLSFMEKSRTDDMQEQDTLDSFNELNENMREDRHKEVMDVFIEATKAKRKAEKDMAREAKKREREAKKEAPPPKPEAPKPQPKPEAPPAKTEATLPKTQTRTEAPSTAKPVETVPSAPTAAPAPPVTTPKLPMVNPAVTEAAKSAAKVGLGVGAAVVTSQAIAGAESGNDYTVSYGDSPKSKKRKAVEMTGKNITEMTLSELEEYQKKRGPKENAVGKYQMIQSTLFGTPGVPGTGLVNQLKLDKDKTLFDEKTQD